MDTIKSEIDALRKKLELLVSSRNEKFLSEKNIMECSQRLDELITLYYKQTTKSSIHIPGFP